MKNKTNQDIASELYKALTKTGVININTSEKDLENFLNNIKPILKEILCKQD